MQTTAPPNPDSPPSALRCAAAWGLWRAHPRAVRSRAILRTFKDRHAGQRCVIIGNGPSLRGMDLSPLRDETTFGMNRIYLHFGEMGFTTTYYTCVNELVLQQCAADIECLAMPRFLAWPARKYVRGGVCVRCHRSEPVGFSDDPARGLWIGATVTYFTLQLAFYMGFTTVVLIGVDHTFATQGPANQVVTSTGDDPNHFSGAYFGSGFRWQLPDLDASERAYRLARQRYEVAGRRVLDATVGGRLTVFEKVAYDSLFC